MQNDDSLNQLEILDRYLDGELSEEETQALTYQLQRDKNLQQQLDILLLSRDAVRSEGLRDKIRAFHREQMHSPDRRASDVTAETDRRTIRPVYVWPLRIAAALLIGMLGYGVMQYALLSPSEIYEEEYLSYRLPVSRSNTTYQMTRLDSLYLQQNYPAVIQKFETQSNKSRRDYFLAGIAYLENQAYAEAITNFRYLQQSAEQNEEATFAEESDYYLALAYLQDGQVEKALSLFEAIHQNPEHLYHARISSTDIWKLRLLKAKQ